MLTTREAFLLVRHTAELIGAYEAALDPRNRPYYEDLCARLAGDRHGYRGISRDPLVPLSFGVADDYEPAARQRYAELADAKPDDFVHDLLPSLAAARDVQRLLVAADRYEILRIRSGDFVPDPLTLGYDIGYWAGDHFSLICDSAVLPTWHPPQPEAFQSLVDALRALNTHFLFSTHEEAEAFRSYYCSQAWAETESESGEFCVIEVAGPFPRVRRSKGSCRGWGRWGGAGR